MNGGELTALEVLRAEVNGKLDLLLERTSDLRSGYTDHEVRIRDLEEHGSANAQEALKDMKEIRNTLNSIQTRVWMAVGGITVTVFVVNIGLAKGWF